MAIPVRFSRLRLLEIPFVMDSPKLHRFLFHNCRLALRNIHLRATNCCGTLCDSVGLYKDGNSSNNCSCFHPSHRGIKKILLLDLKVIFDDDKFIIVREFFSKKFTRLFFKSENYNGGIDSMVEEHKVIGKIQVAVKKIIEQVNTYCGWTVSGWLRRGFVFDAQKEYTSKTIREQYLSGSLHYHISTIVFSYAKPSEFNYLDNILNTHRVDISDLKT